MDQAVWVLARAEIIVLCVWAKQFPVSLTVPFFIQVQKWVREITRARSPN